MISTPGFRYSFHEPHMSRHDCGCVRDMDSMESLGPEEFTTHALRLQELSPFMDPCFSCGHVKDDFFPRLREDFAAEARLHGGASGSIGDGFTSAISCMNCFARSALLLQEPARDVHGQLQVG